MDNAQKAIMIGVGLFITIIVIAAVMAITGIGTNLLNQGQSQLGGLSAQLEQQLTAEYDNVQMTGAQVRAAIQKYYSDPKMVVAFTNTTSVNTTAAAFTPTAWITSNTVTPVTNNTTGTIGVTTSATALTAQTQSTVSTYTNQIPTTGQYRAVLIRNANSAVLGIAFLKIS